PGPRRNADDRDAGWFAPVATRRRPMLGPFGGLRLWLAVLFRGDDPPEPPAWPALEGGRGRRPGSGGGGLVLGEGWPCSGGGLGGAAAGVGRGVGGWVSVGAVGLVQVHVGGSGVGWSGCVAVSSQLGVGWPSLAGWDGRGVLGGVTSGGSGMGYGALGPF